MRRLQSTGAWRNKALMNATHRSQATATTPYIHDQHAHISIAYFPLYTALVTGLSINKRQDSRLEFIANRTRLHFFPLAVLKSAHAPICDLVKSSRQRRLARNMKDEEARGERDEAVESVEGLGGPTGSPSDGNLPSERDCLNHRCQEPRR